MTRSHDEEPAKPAPADGRGNAAAPGGGHRGPLDLLALQRLAGNRAVGRVAGSRRLQRLIGVELETRIPIFDPVNGSYPGYPSHIAEDRRNEFHVDIDKATLHYQGRRKKMAKWSVLEFVVHPIDEHAGTSAEAVEALQKRIRRVERFVVKAASLDYGTRFADLAPFHEMTVAPEYQGAQLNMPWNDTDERLTGPVHFTVGVAPSKVPQLAGELAASSRLKRPRRRAADAQYVADLVALEAAPTEGVDAQRLAGLMSLLYIHTATMLDSERFRGGLVKNQTLALPRVPFGTMFRDLPAEEQKWLTANRKTLVELMRLVYSKHDTGWSSTITVKKPKYAKAAFEGAFTGAIEDPTEAYGKMTVIKAGEWVGTGAGKQLGYALELRDFPQLYESWPERYRAAKELIERSRRLHGTDAGVSDVIGLEETAPAPGTGPVSAVPPSTVGTGWAWFTP